MITLLSFLSKALLKCRSLLASQYCYFVLSLRGILGANFWAQLLCEVRLLYLKSSVKVSLFSLIILYIKSEQYILKSVMVLML